MAKYNCVYWWVGGTENGKWRRAEAGTCDDIRKMGYVAYDGRVDAGPPEGAPTEKDFACVLPTIYNK